MASSSCLQAATGSSEGRRWSSRQTHSAAQPYPSCWSAEALWPRSQQCAQSRWRSAFFLRLGLKMNCSSAWMASGLQETCSTGLKLWPKRPGTGVICRTDREQWVGPGLKSRLDSYTGKCPSDLSHLSLSESLKLKKNFFFFFYQFWKPRAVPYPMSFCESPEAGELKC